MSVNQVLANGQETTVPCLYVQSQLIDFNCCFAVHFDKYKIILPTNAPFIKT